MTEQGRAAVLARVRRALGRPQGEAVPEVVRERLQTPRANTIPARSRLQQPQLTALFTQMVTQSQATLAEVPDWGALPSAVADWLEQQQLPAEVVLAAANPMQRLSWSMVGVRLQSRPARSGDPVAIGLACAGIAETGTLAMASGAANPVTSNFLPEHQLLVLSATDVVGAAEDLWALRRERGLPMPRTLNWITGPSRSADIEMTMVPGAHGPVGLHVLLVHDTPLETD